MGLGLNTEYDRDFMFSPKDLVLIGGRRGQGKSVTCTNIAHNVYQSGRSAIYFTIEMDSRSILQRCCAIATGIPQNRIASGNLTNLEFERMAAWQAARFVNGQERYKEYLESTTRDYNEFHHKLTSQHELLPTQQLDVVYDPGLTLAKIRAELDKKVGRINAGVIIVDYINQVKRSTVPSRGGQYDWTEQIEVSKALKSMAQE
jgi:replicative DNA helicase